MCGFRYKNCWKPVDCEAFRFGKLDLVATVSLQILNFLYATGSTTICQYIGNMFQSSFYRNTEKQTGNVSDYNQIGELSYLGWRGKKKRVCVIICWNGCN
jgi:hypothetical protein